MKKIYILVLLFTIFLTLDSVKAEDFYEAEYFNTYVNKKKDNKTYYLTMQTIRDRDNNNKMIYCLEPFKFFDSNTTYRRIDSINYSLTEEQMDLIRKITYYGFGYRPKHRVTYEWYAITQVLIWKVVDPNADIYFTNGLNGTRDDITYQAKIDELLYDINSNRFDIDVSKDYQVVYNNNLEISLNSNYEIIDSNINYTYDNNILKIDNIKQDGYIIVKENANREYRGDEVIFDSADAQDLYLPGSLKDKVFKINIDVLMGDITLNINKDKETYSVDADFSNTCYGIYKDDVMIQKVCANDEYKYKTEELEVGDYEVRQLSNGIGYIKDDNIYSVSINEYNLHPVVNLYNTIKSNEVNLVKRYCDEEKCNLESRARFEVYDSKKNLVNIYETNNNGMVGFKLGYGKYDVIQTSGIEGYKFVNSFNVFIDDIEENLYYELYDKKIEEELKKEVIIDDIIDDDNSLVEEEIIEKPIQEENDIATEEENVCYENIGTVTPPDTGLVIVLKNNKWIKMIYNNILDIIRRYAKFAVLL